MYCKDLELQPAQWQALQQKQLSNGMSREAYVQKLKDWYTQPRIELPPKTRQQCLNLPYDAQSPRQKVDIYTPPCGFDFPVLFWVHGGAWYTGDRSDFGVQAMMLFVERGYAVVSVGYRLSDEAIFPAQLNDVRAAIAFIRDNAAKYGLDTSRMGMCSGSAGTTLAAIACLESGLFRAMQLNCAILDFAHMTEQFSAIALRRGRFAPPEEDTSIEAMLLGGAIAEQAERCSRATPIGYARKDAPHMLLLHGMVDIDTPYLQSVEFAREINRITGDKTRAEVILFEKTGHDNGEYDAPGTVQKRLDFFDKYLGKEQKT